ncbi:MAG: aspartate aminotransferase family protein [Bacteroidetes bacterium]|jgi:acetylornithine/succinyldiaminopimelate/putrescine aminotransferase|nr:aspartate aminotransferase family protein [Bacteroidota bacterium]MBT5528124.1 aspartate aminotransferase family protein [Cytophagia bacterium]MBT3801035.1 aspartate aminotransferase family protein [Bacteroidota bacterium]MBT3935488.1 aspartate aminotransferase family protein [Bacteroidota bacterium]MBT4339662.1 aspartate aminotransferase family protein [Bacteroidota bacterium]
MENLFQSYKTHLAQTTNFAPVQLEIEKAEGIYLHDKEGKKYIDLISGVAVNNLGHRHPKIMDAIQKQLDKYLHIMVYGEFVQEETVKLAEKLASLLPTSLSSSFFVNSGSEAIEGAIKLAKLHSNRYEIISFKGSYHGSTQATLSLLGDEKFKNPFRPLAPLQKQLEFNNFEQIKEITSQTACVIIEPIQTASGMIMPKDNFLQSVREQCNKTGVLLIFDEIQTALGRTGKLFALDYFHVVPDILCLAKSLGGGLPIGAFISSPEIMNSLNNGHPLMGHATTFGGHPMVCATALATLEVLSSENYLKEIESKSLLFRKLLVHSKIKEIRGTGFLLAVDLGNAEITQKFVENVIPNGLITYWFLFDNTSFSIIPPLTITEEEIEESCAIILKTLDEI